MNKKKQPDYLDYVYDSKQTLRYSGYQKKYFHTIRESDKVILQMIKHSLINNKRKKISLLDIGCSTGNLLFHIKNNFPDFKLYGGDMAEKIIAGCKNNINLKGISFEVMNALKLPHHNTFDYIIANAIFFALNEQYFIEAISSLSNALKKNGNLIVFDWMHPFKQEVSIIEKSKLFPNGLFIQSRSFDTYRKILSKNGFNKIAFSPFGIPVNLKKPKDLSDISSYTINTTSDERLCFRGAIYQPWCHLIANKNA